MNREQLEESAEQYGLVNFNPDDAEEAKRGFMDGALWRINSIWHTLPKDLPQKENTLSGESISLSYQFGEQAWLKKVHLQNMTIRANMNDLFYFSTVKEERGTSYPFARTVSFTVNMTF